MAPVVETRPGGPLRIAVEAADVGARGLRDVAPRRLDQAKLAASLVRQLGAVGMMAQRLDAAVLGGFAADDAARLGTYLADCERLTMAAPTVEGLVSLLGSLAARTVVVALGEASPVETPDGRVLARSLAAHDPGLERRLQRDLLASLRLGSPRRPVGYEAADLVIEERPGRAAALELAEPTAKVQIKWLSTAVGRDGGALAPTVAAPGFGASAIVVAPSRETLVKGRDVQVAIGDLAMSAETALTFAGDTLRGALARWTERLGVPFGALKQIQVLSPYLAIAGRIGVTLTGRAGATAALRFVDHAYGWQPLLTLCSLVADRESPALLVDATALPRLSCTLVWGGA